MTTEIKKIIESQRNFFNSGETKNLDFRIKKLKKLKEAIHENQGEILEALRKDMNKSKLEAYASELERLNAEIDYACKHLNKWAKPEKVKSPLISFPSESFLYKEPLGVALIIGPWNFPIFCLLGPLIGAMAAGNCSVLKPSELSERSSKITKKIIEENFDPQYIAVVEGGAEISQELLKERFDHIFFTGGIGVGKIVMKAAAEHLTPVALELGGKSPCIVDEVSDLKITAKRILWGKFMNCGQCCISPDYILVRKGLKEKLIESFKEVLHDFYGTIPSLSEDYGRIINSRHFERLEALMTDAKSKGAEIVLGGESSKEDLYISPTLVDLKMDTSNYQTVQIMEEEIFGPLLPILEFSNLNEAINFINERPKPLALYLFSENKESQDKVLESTSSGGVTINDTLIHSRPDNLPFGGVGTSGMGRYHGKYSFDTFSHEKSVVKRSFKLEQGFKYPPHKGKFETLSKIFKK